MLSDTAFRISLSFYVIKFEIAQDYHTVGDLCIGPCSTAIKGTI